MNVASHDHRSPAQNTKKEQIILLDTNVVIDMIDPKSDMDVEIRDILVNDIDKIRIVAEVNAELKKLIKRKKQHDKKDFDGTILDKIMKQCEPMLRVGDEYCELEKELENIKMNERKLERWFILKYRYLVKKKKIEGKFDITQEEKKKHFDELISNEGGKEKLFNILYDRKKNDLKIMAQAMKCANNNPNHDVILISSDGDFHIFDSILNKKMKLEYPGDIPTRITDN